MLNGSHATTEKDRYCKFLSLSLSLAVELGYRAFLSFRLTVYPIFVQLHSQSNNCYTAYRIPTKVLHISWYLMSTMKCFIVIECARVYALRITYTRMLK